MLKRPPWIHLYLIGLSIAFLVSTDVGQFRSLLGSTEESLLWQQEAAINSTSGKKGQKEKPSPLDSLGLTIESVLNDEDKSIRSWGCNITTTPFVFVHIGKAGGGNVRRRIASAALNVTRTANNWRNPRKDDHYYPITAPDGSEHRAKFCSSQRFRHQPSVYRSFEGFSQRCTADTLLGHILACPEFFNLGCGEQYHPLDPNAAHLVYAGHNHFGTEVHWLPIPYLKDWWSTFWSRARIDQLDPVLEKINSLDGELQWCRDLPRPLLVNDVDEKDREQYWDCAKDHIQPQADAWARKTVLQRFSKDVLTPKQQGRAWGQMYASLPVTRVTLLREPWSWLSSKYAWHKIAKRYDMQCDDLTLATIIGPAVAEEQRSDRKRTRALLAKNRNNSSDHRSTVLHIRSTNNSKFSDDMYTDLHLHFRPGWARMMALGYILQLCGEDCHTRLEAGHATLDEIEAQAAYNLRHSFAVVGLLHEQETFLDMLHARVDYINMHLPDAEVFMGGKHKSKKDEYCAELFHDPKYQRDLLAAAPEMRALLRLYEVGVQVNRFQMQELEQCSGMLLRPEMEIQTDEEQDSDYDDSDDDE